MPPTSVDTYRLLTQPSDESDRIERLALVAVVGADGSLQIVAIPDPTRSPDQLQSSLGMQRMHRLRQFTVAQTITGQGVAIISVQNARVLGRLDRLASN